MLADEVDRYPASAGNEGDSLLLAYKRLTTYWNKKSVIVSTPTIKEASRIETEYENSTRETWNVPCPSCGELQPLEWGQVKYDREDLSEINYICGKCGVGDTEIAWKEHYTSGKFIPQNPDPDSTVRGFYLNSLASLFVEWRDIVEGFIKANEEIKKGNVEFMKVWTNTEMAQTWEEKGHEIDPETLYNRSEEYGCEVPNGVLYLTAGVDTQDNRFEIEVVGWGEYRESWGIKYVIMYGDLKQKKVWDELKQFLSQTFTREDGAKLKLTRACIDMGGHFTNEVLNFCKPLFPSVLPIRGRDGFDVPYIPRASKNNRADTPMWTLGVDSGKDWIYKSLDVKDEGANFCHFPSDKGTGYTEEYFKGLTAEKMVMRYKRGKAQFVWELKSKGTRNEPLDCRNYALAALEISGVILKKSEGTLAPKKRNRSVRGQGV